jgi:hypothetical protein
MRRHDPGPELLEALFLLETLPLSPLRLQIAADLPKLARTRKLQSAELRILRRNDSFSCTPRQFTLTCEPRLKFSRNVKLALCLMSS